MTAANASHKLISLKHWLLRPLRNEHPTGTPRVKAPSLVTLVSLATWCFQNTNLISSSPRVFHSLYWLVHELSCCIVHIGYSRTMYRITFKVLGSGWHSVYQYHFHSNWSSAQILLLFLITILLFNYFLSLFIIFFIIFIFFFFIVALTTHYGHW